MSVGAGIAHQPVLTDQHEGRGAAHAVLLELDAARVRGHRAGKRLGMFAQELFEFLGVLVADGDDGNAALPAEGPQLGQRLLAVRAPGRPEEEQP